MQGEKSADLHGLASLAQQFEAVHVYLGY